MSNEKSIPYRHLESWMHKRIQIPQESLDQRFKRWKHQPTIAIAMDAVLSRLLLITRIAKKNNRWVLYKVVARFFRLIFEIFNRFKIIGIENIPKNGCIFTVSHPGVLDPLILGAAVPFPVSMFIAWGNGWFSDFTDEYLGFLAFRGRDNRDVKIEKFIRQILLKNRFFAIWPEGHPTNTPFVEQGFSSIVRAYSVINSKKNIIPFVPVLIQGGHIYKYPPYPRPGQIIIRFLEPYYVPREWLNCPDKGGKTPREIIDVIMNKIAQANGQKTFVDNRLLVGKKKRYSRQ